jgi:hypothetical protein
MSAEGFARELAGRGLRCSVEAKDALAVLRLDDPVAALALSGGRDEIVRLARDHGFTHVALELPRAVGR